MRRICIYGRYDEKVGQITTGIPCFAFFCDWTRSQLSFLNSLITRAPSSGNWCRYLGAYILVYFPQSNDISVSYKKDFYYMYTYLFPIGLNLQYGPYAPSSGNWCRYLGAYILVYFPQSNDISVSYKKDFYYMYTYLFPIGLNLQYGPYAHFGYWVLISDP